MFCYAQLNMRRLGWILICLAMMCLGASLRADTFTLTDGSQVSGDPVSPYTDEGVVFKQGDAYSPRVSWDRFTQDSIHKLLDNAKTAGDKELVQPLIDTTGQQKAKRNDITVHPVELPPRPAHPAAVTGIFFSPLGWFIILVLYGATIFAAFEVAVYRKHPRGLVCGLAAIPFLGVLSPALFLAISPQQHTVEEEPVEVTTDVQTQAPQSNVVPGSTRRRPGEASASTAASMPTVPPVPTLPGTAPAVAPAIELPPPVVYARGETSFNRRFFETKLAGFFRAVPSPAEKDLLVHIKSARGDYTGRRITRITAAELYLQISKGDATADEMIPFTEILEVQVRHKDLA
jgi:hypothetical protein